MDMTQKVDALREKLKQLDSSIQRLKTVATLTPEQWDEQAGKVEHIRDMVSNVIQLRPRRP